MERLFCLKTIVQVGAWICFLYGVLWWAAVMEFFTDGYWYDWNEAVQLVTIASLSFLPFLAVVYPQFKFSGKWLIKIAGILEVFVVFLLFRDLGF